MKDNILSCREARQIDMVDTLLSLATILKKYMGLIIGICPLPARKNRFFQGKPAAQYLVRPCRGAGGDLIDFGTQFHRCTIPELLNRLSQYQSGPTFLFQKASPSGFPGAGEKEGSRGVRS